MLDPHVIFTPFETPVLINPYSKMSFGHPLLLPLRVGRSDKRYNMGGCAGNSLPEFVLSYVFQPAAQLIGLNDIFKGKKLKKQSCPKSWENSVHKVPVSNSKVGLFSPPFITSETENKCPTHIDLSLNNWTAQALHRKWKKIAKVVSTFCHLPFGHCPCTENDCMGCLYRLLLWPTAVF